LGDPGVDGRIILRWIFRKWDVGAWAGLVENLLAFQEELCCME
jgi:hypothetical protein